MGKFIDRTGQKFGRLTVIERFIEEGKPRRRTQWKVSCECGTEKVVDSDNMVAGKIKSCGCLALEKNKTNFKGKTPANTLEKGEGSLSCLINRYRVGARRRGFEYNLTREEFRKLSKQNCNYCGLEPSKSIQGQRSNGEYTYNGIDRIDSSKGYFKENCVPCCEFCNKAKLNHSLEEFNNWIERIINFRKEKENDNL